MGFSSFYSGLSGLQAHAARLNVIGNNLANVNTIGFKSSRMTFQDIFSQTLGGVSLANATNPMQVGLGVQIGAVDQVFTQGSLQTTGLVTDLALQGSGFFITRAPSGTMLYTRAGAFSFDKDGFLVAPSGAVVQGFTTTGPTGQIVAAGTPSDIQIPAGLSAPPNPTANFTAAVNLNADAAVDDPATAANNEAEIYITTVPVYDSLGGRHDVSITFTPVDTDADMVLDEWTYEIAVDGGDVTGGTAGTPYVLDTGTIQFDAQGQPVAPAGNVTFNIPAWSNGAAAQAVTWNVFEPSGLANLTGYVGDSATSALQQDGYSVGQLSFLTVDSNGLMEGVFTNGETLQLAQIALATFNSNNGLISVGQNSYVETQASGPPAMGVANTGGRGSLVSGTLELSNVDITSEFTDLIISERGYQANSRIITTTDQIMEEALNLKR